MTDIARTYYVNREWKGVNLGGYFVLERWITPQLFEELTESYQGDLGFWLGPRDNNAATKLLHHWEHFVSEDDIERLAKWGINSVRVPIGYWLYPDFARNDPFENFAPIYHQHCLPILFRLFDWCLKYGIGVLICLHGAPGGQNGEHHSGKADRKEWFKDEEKRKLTMDLLHRLVQDFNPFHNFIGIELLNEPTIWEDIASGKQILKDFYERANTSLRNSFKEEFFIVFSDAFLPEDWNGVLEYPRCLRTVMDTHHYVVFDDNLRQKSATELCLLQKEAGTRFQKIRGNLFCEHPRNIIVGEWSLAMHPSQLRDVDPSSASRSFAKAQLLAFQNLRGWFFWTLKLDRTDYELWDFSKCVKRGILPDYFGLGNLRDISDQKEEAQRKALEDHLRYWKEDPSKGWHFSHGFGAGWEKQIQFASRGTFIGSIWELALEATENHLSYHREKGSDFKDMAWHFRHGYISGVMKAKDSYLLVTQTIDPYQTIDPDQN